jgi:hypothetical protein
MSNKQIILFFFILAMLNVIRHSYFFIQKLLSDDNAKYIISRDKLIILGASISYIITYIIK